MNRTATKIIQFFIMNCRDATCEIEKELQGTISPLQKIRLKAHLFLCKWCSIYYRKVLLIHSNLKNFINKKAENTHENPLNINGLKRFIKNKIKNNQS